MPIDVRSERSEFIRDVLHDKFNPVILLLGRRPEKLHQETPAALLAEYMRILCIANHLPMEVIVSDLNFRKISATIQDIVSNSSSRLGDLDTTRRLPKLTIPGNALAACAKVLGMPYLKPATLSFAPSTDSTTFPPLDLNAKGAKTKSPDQETNNGPDCDPRVTPYDSFDSDALREVFRGQTRTQLTITARHLSLDMAPLDDQFANEQLILAIIE